MTKDWEAENDVDTMIRAQEILDSPIRKKKALAVIKKRNKATDKAAAQLVTKTAKRLKKTFKG